MNSEPFKITVGEMSMPPYIAKDKQDLVKLIDFLISHKREISVKIEGNRSLYTSRIISAEYGDLFSKMSEESKLVIEMLTPYTGNALVKLSPKVAVQFLLGDKPCQFDSRYLGESTENPPIGLIVSFPESVKFADRRSYERDTEKIPVFLFATLTLRPGAEDTVTYKLEIINRSAYGVGMLVTKKDFDLLEMIKEGDELQDLELYAPSTVIKVTGSVRHISKLEEPNGEVSYMLGIKLDETLEDFHLS